MKLALGISGIPGLVVAALMMAVAWDHNPQGEIHTEETGINWTYWLLIGASWFAAISAPVFACVILWLRSRSLRR